MRVRAVDRECTADDLDLMREPRVGDVRAASRDLLGVQPEECRNNGGTRGCVGDPHLAGQNTAVARIGTHICERNARFDGLYCLRACHGRPFCHIRRAACNAVVQQSRNVGTFHIHAEIGDDECGVCVVCCCICRRTVRDEIVAHHVLRRLGRIGTDAFGSNAVVGAGDDDARLRGCGMALACDANVFEQSGGQPSEILPHLLLLCTIYGISNHTIRNGDGRYRLFEQIHARAFSFSMRFKERPMRPRASSMLMIITSRASPTASTSSG